MAKEWTKIATAVEQSKNAKVGTVSATYASLHSCPSSCPFKGKGCYAQSGNVFFTVKKLDKCASETNRTCPESIAREEANAIDKLSGKLPLRLHVSGDCTTNESAKIVSEACKSYAEKHGQPVWTYTHAWRQVDREAWGSVSVYASCETVDQCKEAISKGYAAAMVTGEAMEKSEKRDGLKLTPCKEQSKGTPCVDCKLCFKDSNKKRVIVFGAHGSGAKKVKEALDNVQ